MSELPAALDAELAKDSALIFGALKIELPGKTLRLLDGASELDFGGETYTGEDPDMGSWADVEGLEDGAGDQVPDFSVTLHPPDGAAAADLSDPSFQGSKVTIYVGAMDKTDGAVIDPYAFIVGEIDVPTLYAGKASLRVEYDCVSAMDRFFELNDAARLSSSLHKSFWPGETGFDNITAIPRKEGWGVADGSAAVAGGTGTGYGGGTGSYNRPPSYLTGLQ